MKRNVLVAVGLGVILSAIALVFVLSEVEGAVPQLINFQGILRDGSGNPVANGPYSVTFTIYGPPPVDPVLWSQTYSVTTSNGLFTVLLGAGTPVPDTAFNNPDRWLGIKVGADPEMTPRQRLVSVSYGYRVSSVDGALGGSINGSLSFGNSAAPMEYIYESGISNPTRPVIAHSPAYPDWGLAYDDANDRMTFQGGGLDVMTADLNFRSVGVRTTTPNSPLHVNGAIATAVTTVNSPTSSITLDASNSVILCNAVLGTITVNLPTAVGIAGRQYTIKLIFSNFGTVIIDPFGSENIEGAATYAFGTQYRYVTIVSDGANWWIVANN